MKINLTRCEIEKDIEKLKHFDLIIFHKSDNYSLQTLAQLQTFSNHFSDFKIASYLVTDYNEKLIDDSKSFIYLSANDDDFNNFCQLNYNTCVFSNKANIPFNSNLSLLGFQRHLIELNKIFDLESKLNFAYSLGMVDMYEDIIEAELRSNNINIINFNILKKHYNIDDSQDTGINLEKLIQLIRYSTNSESYKGTIFYSGNFDTSKSELSLFTAECIWYLIEGIYSGPEKIEHQNIRVLSFLKDLDFEVEIISNENGKYWIKTDNSKEIACTAKEYMELLNGELSQRLLRRLRM